MTTFGGDLKDVKMRAFEERIALHISEVLFLSKHTNLFQLLTNYADTPFLNVMVDDVTDVCFRHFFVDQCEINSYVSE